MQHRARIVGIFSALLIGALAGCGDGKDEGGEGPSQVAPAAGSEQAGQPTASSSGGSAAAEAKQIFDSRCQPCHGATGQGDGPASAGLNPKPRAFGDSDWQSEVSDEHIEQIIQYGGPAVGRSAAMPGNPDLTSKPEVVEELRKMIRSFGG